MTASVGPRIASFRQRLRAGEPLLGTFVKTPSPVVCEVLGQTQMDVVCLDSEHAPFGRVELDTCIAMLRAADLPVLVRTRSDAPTELLGALDSGATGVVVPHVTDAGQAADIARAARFGPGGRGFAGSPRAAGYTTTPRPEYLRAAQEQTVVIAQIEDRDALENLNDIATVDGLDCLFVGRSDLTVSLGVDAPADPAVVAAVEQVCAAGRDHSMRIGMFTGNHAELPQWRAQGASLFLLTSDHGFLLDGAVQLVAEFRNSV
ncbi:MAG: aldolase/citrate lyase family protein [Gammaproteobacteria bacterium]|nr:aldolase/citrate lyase family protein [Gammaproteobacteria bacterium]